MRSTVTMKIEDRLDSIKQLILSRTKLEAIIQEFNLYPDERRNGLMEELVERMRNNDISMSVAKGDAFRISFVSSDPKQAQRVTERLTSLFIAENLRDREVVAERSSQFLESQLNEVRQLMETTEKKLAAYRLRNQGTLPENAPKPAAEAAPAASPLRSPSVSSHRCSRRSPSLTFWSA